MLSLCKNSDSSAKFFEGSITLPNFPEYFLKENGKGTNKQLELKSRIFLCFLREKKFNRPWLLNS